MNDLVENKIKSYSCLQSTTGPVTVNDYVNDRFNNVHNQLFEDALNKLLTQLAKNAYYDNFEDNIILDKSQLDMLLLSNEKMSLDEFVEAYIKWVRKTHKCIEVKNLDYSSYSSVYIVNTEFPYTKKKYSLKNYWNTIEHSTTTKTINDLHLDDETLKYAELQYVDYVKGQCKYKSKLNGEEFWVPFDYINSSDDIYYYMQTNTFSNLLKTSN